MSLILLVAVVLLVLYKINRFVFDKPPNSPPGIPRLPIWGSYWFLLWGNYKFPNRNISYYTKKYKSKIISCFLGDFFAVVVSDYRTIKEVLTRSEFDGRVDEAHIFKARAFGKKFGVFFTDGPAWQEQRRFALRYMRDFGFGRRMDKLESEIAEEITILIDTLKNGPINSEEEMVVGKGRALFPDVLYAACANSIWAVVAGQRLDRSNHNRLRDVCRSAMMFQRSGDTTGGAILQTPWLQYFAHGFGFPGFVQGTEGMKRFIREFLNNHKSTLTEEEEKRGFLDVCIQKLKESKELSNISEEQLIVIVLDFIFPPLSASPTVLTNIIKCMVLYPHVFKKVQAEIDATVGRGRLPTLDDRTSLNYTEATIREVMRMETTTPLAVAHRTTEDTTLCGYHIPANTVVLPDLYSMHKDPDHWGDPENFRPDRFLTETGSLGKDYSLPFGAGRRICAGETFARNSIFLIFAGLAQNFDFSSIKGEPSGMQDNYSGLIVTPKEAWIKVTQRS